MKLNYYPETDSLYIDLKSVAASDSNEVADGVVLDLDADGNVVGIDIQQASRRLDLMEIQSETLPVRAKRSA